MNFNSYLHEFNRHINNKNGSSLSLLLTYKKSQHATSDRLLGTFSPDLVEKIVPAPWNDMCIFHLNCCKYIRDSNFSMAYKEQSNLIQYFTKAISGMINENWMLPVLNILIRDLRLLAIAADLETSIRKNEKVQKPHVNLEKAADLLMGLFRISATDSRSQLETSKRLSMMNIINQLFKIYFKINKLHLCKPLTRALDNSKIANCFNLAERVTYNYFLGLKYMFDSDYKNADKLLSFSFRNCHHQSFKNKKLILIYLIPVKMLIGVMPSNKLLKEYGLEYFQDIVLAIKQGNLRMLDYAIEKNSEFFWKFGIYLNLEKLKIIAYRNVFKKVMLISKTHQIPITMFQTALNYLQDEQISIEEVHCILANLISDGKVKGYISLQYQKLVVSKQNPFPNLTTIA